MDMAIASWISGVARKDKQGGAVLGARKMEGFCRIEARPKINLKGVKFNWGWLCS